MKKLIITLLISLIVLSGCVDYPSFKDMTVKDKVSIEGNMITSNKYIVTLEKNRQEIDLSTDYINYNALRVGQTINVTYDSQYYIVEIGFPELEGGE